jgi:cation diffusion facilitator CzcD-associated flavoprotein CzcO
LVRSSTYLLHPYLTLLQEYLIGVAQKYELYRYIRFNNSVESAQWDDTEKKWKISVKVTGSKDAEFGGSYILKTDFLVSAVGQLNVPRYHEILGLNDFQGRTMHSARWDWAYKLEGKRIAVIGNGCTAVQIIPEIAKVASQLTVHQRTPNWITPRGDVPVSSLKRAIFKYVPPVRWRHRAEIMDFQESFHPAITDAESPFAHMLKDMSKAMMKAQLPDKPDLWDKLTPDYPPGCKRVIASDDYFPVFNQEIVSLETRPISKITEKGIEVDGEETEYDLIVLATGFRTVEFMHPIKIIGAGGRPLSEIWAKGARGLYGITVESLPNFGMLYGPNTNLGHNSIMLMIEAESRYICALVAEVLRARQAGNDLVVTPKKERLEEFNDEMQKKLNSSSFAHPNCQSWYKNETGVITNNWSGTVVEYQKLLERVKWTDYELSGDGAEAVPETSLKIPRVVEETCISHTMLVLGIVSTLAVGAGWVLRSSGRLRVR